MFTDNEKDKIIKKLNIYKKIKFHNTGDFFNILNKIKGKNCQIDLDTCSLYEENLISNKFNISSFFWPNNRIYFIIIKQTFNIK